MKHLGTLYRNSEGGEWVASASSSVRMIGPNTLTLPGGESLVFFNDGMVQIWAPFDEEDVEELTQKHLVDALNKLLPGAYPVHEERL